MRYVYELRYVHTAVPFQPMRVRFQTMERMVRFMRNHDRIAGEPELVRMEIKNGIVNDGIVETIPLRQMRNGRWGIAGDFVQEAR